MATLSAAAQALLQDPIDLLLKGTARETPVSQDVIQRVALLTDSVSGGPTSGLIFESFRDRPISTLIEIVAEVGYPVLTAAQTAQLADAVNLMTQGTAYEDQSFAEDVVQRLAPVAASTGFMTVGGFYDAIRDRPVSTMLQWALKLGSV